MQNIGLIDRVLRTGSGFVLFAVFLLDVVTRQSDMRLLGLVATLLLLTAVLGYCPVYGFFGINSLGFDQLRFIKERWKLSLPGRLHS